MDGETWLSQGGPQTYLDLGSEGVSFITVGMDALDPIKWNRAIWLHAQSGFLMPS